MPRGTKDGALPKVCAFFTAIVLNLLNPISVKACD